MVASDSGHFVCPSAGCRCSQPLPNRANALSLFGGMLSVRVAVESSSSTSVGEIPRAEETRVLFFEVGVTIEGHLGRRRCDPWTPCSVIDPCSRDTILDYAIGHSVCTAVAGGPMRPIANKPGYSLKDLIC